MKKGLAVFLSLLLCLVTGTAFTEENVYKNSEIGIQFTMPENMENLYVIGDSENLNVLYMDDTGSASLLLVNRLPDDHYAFMMADADYAAAMQQVRAKEIGTLDGYTYVVFSSSFFDSLSDFFLLLMGMDIAAIPESSVQRMEQALPAIGEIAETMTLIPVVQDNRLLGDFTTVDLDGNPVTPEIFTGKDITVVQVWATYCSACIEGMPALAAWDKELPDNMQVIGLVSDVFTGDDPSLAKTITEIAGADYPNLVVSGTMMDVLAKVQYVPTTFFVNSQGELLSPGIVGMELEQLKAFVEGYTP